MSKQLYYHVLDCSYNLSKEWFGFRLLQTSIVGDFREQFTTAGILHHKMKLRKCLNDLVQADHIWMMKPFHAGDLA